MRHVYGSCHDEDCPACEKRSQERAEDYDADPYGWQADIAADRYELHLDQLGGTR